MKIQIQTIAHGSNVYAGHGSDKYCTTVEDMIKAYTKVKSFLKKGGETITPQKIENELLEDGIIAPENGSGADLFNDCLVENKFIPTFFSGTFHSIGIAGRPKKVIQVIDYIKTPRLDYSSCRKPTTAHSVPTDFNLSQFSSILDLERFLTTFNKDSKKDNLFEQIKRLEDPEDNTPKLIYQIEESLIHEGHYSITKGLGQRCHVNRTQIRKILQYCPFVFPENWEGLSDLSEGLQSAAYGNLEKLTDTQGKAYNDITEDRKKSGSYIRYIIQFGVDYRNKLQGKV